MQTVRRSAVRVQMSLITMVMWYIDRDGCSKFTTISHMVKSIT